MKNETKDRHLRNLQRLRDQNAPAEVIESYYETEKISPEDLRIRADESGFPTQFLQGAFMGGYDEAAGFARSLMSGNPYADEVSAVNQGIQNYQSDNPGKAFTGQTLGALGTTAALSAIPGVGAPTGGAAAAANTARLATLARGMGLGAGEGAVAGALSENEDRTSGAIQGGMFGALIPAGANAIGVGKDVVKPLLNSEQEKIVGNLLRSVATDPDRAVRNLQTNADVRVPGSVPTTAQAARDPGLAAFETPVRAVDTANRIGQRAIDQQQARTEMLSQMARDTDAVEFAKGKRDAAALPMLENAFDGADVISEDAYGEEYLGLEIAIRVVDDFEAAVDHIAQFGSNHTEVICTEDAEKGKLFQRAVDASVVMVNASSRFSDGSQLGLGAEIGIATTKLHAYGPMGLESLTSEKYLVNGEGQIRD